MTSSILNECLLLYKKKETIQEYLHSINVTIFDPIFHSSQDLREATQKIMFILCAYSEDSPLLILRQDSKEEKEGICEYLQLPEFMRRPLMELSDIEVRRATTQYLTLFAGPLFKSLQFMKIQYEDFDLDITNRAFSIKKTEEKEGTSITTEIFDSKEHMKAVNELAKLAKTIDVLEKQLRSQITRMEGINDLKEFTRNSKDSGKIKGGRQGNVETAIRN